MPNLSPATATITTAQTIELTTTIANAIWSIVSGAGSLGAGSTAYKKLLTPSGAGTVEVQAASPFYEVINALHTLQSNNNLVVNSNSATDSTRTSAKLGAVGDYIEYPFLAGYGGWIVCGINIGYVLLGLNADIYDFTNYTTFVGNTGNNGAATNGQTIRWEIITGNYLRLSVNGAVRFTSTTALNLTGGNNVRCTYFSYSEPSGTTIVKPTIAGSGVTGYTTETATITVVQVLDITTTSPLPAGTKYSAYSQALATAGGTSPRTVSLHTGELPGGLSLSGNTISGTCTAQGTFNFTLRVTDSVGATYDKSFSLTVNLPSAPTISTTSPLSNGIIDVAYSLQLVKTGQTGTWGSVSGTFPTGISMDSAGLISGTPSAVGTSTNIVIRFTDLDGQWIERTFSITVIDAPPLNYGFSSLEVELFCEALDLEQADNSNITSFTDQSIHSRHLTASSSYPTFQTDEINEKPVVRFSSSNPLKNTDVFTVRCGWILAKYDSANFPDTADGYKGLLSDLVDKKLLSGKRNSNEFFDVGYDLYEFRSNDRIYSVNDDGELHAPAPMDEFNLIFFRFWSPIEVDGIQLGQELSNTNRKWSGDVALLILTSRDFCERDIRARSAFIAEAYDLILADVIPFQGSKSDEITHQRASYVYDPPEGERIAEVLDDSKQTFDLNFSNRSNREFKEMRSYYRNHYPEIPCIYRDYNILPPEDIEGYFDSELRKSGFLNNNYSVRFKEK